MAETVHTMNTMKTAFRLIVFKRLRQGSLFPEEGAGLPCGREQPGGNPGADARLVPPAKANTRKPNQGN